MAKKDKLTKIENNYDTILTNVVEILEQSRRLSARAVNAIMTATYWEIGRQIVEVEQKGEERAKYYGKEIVERLAEDLSKRFGRGFKKSNLYQMRSVFLVYQNIFQTVSGKSSLTEIAKNFPLPWSHYVELLSCREDSERKFYEEESLRGGWSVRQLKRQKDSQFYRRTLLSKNKAEMLKKGEKPLP